MMELYNENMERIENPDLSLGYIRQGVRMVHHAAVKGVREVWHYEVTARYENGGRDVRRVTDVPGVEARQAWTEEIPIEIYVPYTPEELKAMEEEKNRPSVEERLEQMEKAFETLSGRMQSVTAQMTEIRAKMAAKAAQEVK